MTKPTLTSSLHTHLCFLLFLPLLLISHANSQSLQDQEQAVLLKLKSYLQSPPFLSHWIPSTSNTSHCSWQPEITCTNNSVTGLSLVNTNITLPVPPFICDLKNLTHIDLSYNYFAGEFPKAFYNCSKLQYLNLSQNSFDGKIPDNIDSLPRLQYLDLGANYFSGDIPAAIGRLQELRNLQLYMNHFNGSVPPEIGNLSNLKHLSLSFNTKLVPWNLPSNFTKLKNLKNLYIRGSNLIGELPGTLGEMAALEELDLAYNSLNGTIPSVLFLLKNLSIIYLYNNSLSGDVPQVVEALNLTVIDISANHLTGRIPQDYGNLTKLTWLALFLNGFSGAVPASIGRLPNLKQFRVFINNLSGTLPPDLGRYSELEGFEVSGNRLTGKLPDHLCYRGKLSTLVAYENNLTGELPSSLGNCTSLTEVKVYDNGLSGNIPSGMWTAPNLGQVMMSNNSFTGELPEKISRSLTRLEIRDNRFSGNIPTGMSSWNLKVFDAGNNLFNGTIPQELTALPSLITLSLDQNQLTGFLPSEIISWKSLNILNFSRNKLSGPIPAGLGLLPVLTALDLSENQLSGQIPAQLGHLKLSNFNLSSNHLSGKIPIEFENPAYDGSFLDNQGLCATSPSAKLSICNSQPRKSSKIWSTYLALILTFGILLSLLALSLSFFMVRGYWKRNRSGSGWKLTAFQRLNFSVSKILSGLTEGNLIGRGGSGKVYCVPVNRTGDVVAVKKIWKDKKLEEKLEKEFLAEVKILSSIRHANIVKLMCCISKDNSKLLVYEYSENRSLDRWLHKRNRPSNLSRSVHHVVLDWPQRLHIAVGAAQGLRYMHHDCVPPVVHRDVKSSNILLDSDFNAKIADFGLAKMLVKQGELATMSAVAGSFGYIAPECAHRIRVNEKIDVYSFGVVLLELTTGKEANDGDEHTALAEWAWRHVQEDNPLADALDKDIKEPSYLDEMCSVFRLGIYCTEKLPSARPSMKDVTQILLRCGHPGVHREKTDYVGAPLLKNSKHDQILEDGDGSLATNV
ncbi:receptor-like protein kinase 5 [Prunus dulcis]|uniref:receptor-like protein kinase 5 n=1 Tax=Prunus dulcis TaxID=3755 RepID=UPI001482980A|nr:receptor-like protein kinase 5 [Prunus dulcis]